MEVQPGAAELTQVGLRTKFSTPIPSLSFLLSHTTRLFPGVLIEAPSGMLSREGFNDPEGWGNTLN